MAGVKIAWRQVKKDTSLLCVGQGHAGGARVGHVRVEGDLQGVTEGVLVQTASQSPETHSRRQDECICK